MPTERNSHSNASHWRFPYYFSSDDEEAPDGGDKQGINFRNIWFYGNKGDLLIYYTTDIGGENPNYIECWCSRWDASDYSITVETWIKKDDINALRNAIRPGAVGELYSILGKPKFYDKSWTYANTLTFVPLQYTKKVKDEEWEEPFEGSNLKYMRDKRTVYVKNYSEHPIVGPSQFIEIKIEAQISGGTI